MNKKILIATTNQGKKNGMMRVFQHCTDFEFLSLKDFPIVDDLIETGTTFEENAFQKAQYYAEKLNIPTFGEDSGIIIEAFPDKFGVRSRREIEGGEDDSVWLEKFLELLEGQKNRRATFHSTLVFYDPQSKITHTTKGSLSGIITEFPQCPIEKGLPPSCVFIPNGETEVISVLPKEVRKKNSHRGKACLQMVDFLNTYALKN